MFSIKKLSKFSSTGDASIDAFEFAIQMILEILMSVKGYREEIW